MPVLTASSCVGVEGDALSRTRTWGDGGEHRRNGCGGRKREERKAPAETRRLPPEREGSCARSRGTAVEEREKRETERRATPDDLRRVRENVSLTSSTFLHSLGKGVRCSHHTEPGPPRAVIAHVHQGHQIAAFEGAAEGHAISPSQLGQRERHLVPQSTQSQSL